MTIYRLYTDNGNNAGFWVQHRKWGDVCAQVQTVGGARFGKLPGAAPLHERAPVSFHWFDVRSGRPREAPACALEPEDKQYTSIAQPWWSRRATPTRGAHTPASAVTSRA